MATEFMMPPRLPDAPQQHYYNHHHHNHNHQQSAFFAQMVAAQYQQPPAAPTAALYTPQISPLSTSGSNSPTSPKPHTARQIRPLYMPAVLRPNEFPSKVPAPPPPAKLRGDSDGFGGGIYDDDGTEDGAAPRSSGSFISLPGLGALGRLRRRSTGDSGKCVDGSDWNFDMFPMPTGLPTRKHWKPDAASTICDHTTCKRHFTYFTRRHHCRRCGNIFCDYHSSFEIPLDQDANYNPRGTSSRSCAHCYTQFKEWRSRTNSQSSSSQTTGSGDGRDASAAKTNGDVGAGDGSETAPASPVTAPSIAAAAAAWKASSIPVPEVAMSVPRDWSWSTF